MATAAETEASPPRDSSCESGGGGGGGDEEMKRARPQPESSPQNGGGGGPSIWEPGGGAPAPEETAAQATASVSLEQPRDSAEASAAALPKGLEEPEKPVRRIFQIPRKSREKKGGASLLPLLPLSLFPLHLFIRISVSSSHTHPRRKRACSAGRRSLPPSLPHRHGRPAAALRARGRRWNHAPRLGSPSPRGSLGSKLRFEACPQRLQLPERKRWCSEPLPPKPLKAEKPVRPPKDASEKSRCGNSPRPRILELPPKATRCSEDHECCFSLWKFLQLYAST